MAMNSVPWSSAISWIWQTFGWLTLAAARASRQNRCRAVSLSDGDESSFSATVRCSFSSRAA